MRILTGVDCCLSIRRRDDIDNRIPCQILNRRRGRKVIAVVRPNDLCNSPCLKVRGCCFRAVRPPAATHQEGKNRDVHTCAALRRTCAQIAAGSHVVTRQKSAQQGSRRRVSATLQLMIAKRAMLKYCRSSPARRVIAARRSDQETRKSATRVESRVLRSL